MKRFIHRAFLLFAITFVTFSSCKRKSDSADSLVAVQSNPSYVQLVIDRENIPVLEELTARNYLCDSQLITEKGNSFEPKFDYFIGAAESPEQLKLDERIVVIFETKSDFDPFDDIENPTKVRSAVLSKSPEINADIFHDIWGKGQTVVKINLKTADDAEVWLKSNWKSIERLIETENETMGIIGIDGFSDQFDQPNKHSDYTDSIDKLFRSQFNFSLLIPNQYRIMQADSEAIWISNLNKNFGFQSIFINIIRNTRAAKWNLTSWSNNANKDLLQDLISNRNAFTRFYMHNDEGTKMEVSESGIYKCKLKYTKSGNPQLQGWYTELGTYRRGPFFRTLYNDEVHERFIAVDCFFNNTNTNHVNKLLLSNIASTFKIVP